MNIKKIIHEINRLWWGFRITYGIAFLGSGLDKFFNYLIDWHAQGVPEILLNYGFTQDWILHIRGLVEILIGIMLFTRFVKFGAYAAAFWLIVSALYIIVVPGHFDTAMRYAVIALGAYTLARLTVIKGVLLQ